MSEAMKIARERQRAVTHRRWLVVGLAACWRNEPPLPPDHHAAEPGPTSAPCPIGVNGSRAQHFWSHEVFPGCSPPPFAFEGIACSGACPTPCRETIEGGSRTDQNWRNTYRYADGRLTEANGATMSGQTYNNGELQTTHETCEYEHGQLARCNTLRGPMVVHRDDRGRITQIEESDNTMSVTYDPAGQVVALTGTNGLIHSQLRYDARHRLIEETERSSTDKYKYEYDVHSHFVHASLGDERRRYDPATGLFVQSSERISTGSWLATRTITISYDALRRPIRIVDASVPIGMDAATARDLGRSETTEHRYDYDCSH